MLRRFGRLLSLAAVLIGAYALPVAAAQADPPTPYLDQIVAELKDRSPGTEGKVWWLSKGNELPQPTASSPGWLLQSVDCWGKPSCGQPPPGGVSFLRKMDELIAVARKSIDIAELYNFSLTKVNPAYPNGGFYKAIVDGLKRGHRDHPHEVPVIRLLLGVYPPGDPNMELFIQDLKRSVGNWVKVQSGYMRSALYSWNHAKVIDEDGREAIVGGENYWADDYLNSSHPVNDVSMWVKGPAAADVSHFMNILWTFTCDHRLIPANGIKVRIWNTGNGIFPPCIKDAPIDRPAADPNGRTILVVGKLGHGIPVPGEKGKESPPIVRPKLSGNTCNATQAKQDNKDVNNKRDYEYRNPGETALRALIASAKHSIFLSQQDLLSCLPKRYAATEAKFDERAFAALAERIAHGVKVKIVLSSYSTETGGYSNGWETKDVAKVLLEMLEKNERFSEALSRHMLCERVGLTTIRNDAKVSKWSDGLPFYNHAKVVDVDNEAFYIGSGNLYPSGLQELGFIVDDPSAGAHLKQAYLDPLWENSRPGALIDPSAGKCDAF